MVKLQKEINKKTANKVENYTEKLMNYCETKDFESKYKSIINEYEETFPFDSTIALEKLAVFSEWLHELSANMSKIVPILVLKMLKNDIYAFNIYKNLYKGDTILITHRKAMDNQDLFKKYKENGGGIKALGIINAEHWLSSKYAVQIFYDNQLSTQDLCDFNSITGTINTHIDCDESTLV